jgi:hypothetical protein
LMLYGMFDFAIAALLMDSVVLRGRPRGWSVSSP